MPQASAQEALARRQTPIDLREPPSTPGTVAVVGLGYVGLPTALAFHAAGRPVVGVDVSSDRLDAIRTSQVDLLPRDRARLDAALASPSLSLVTDPDALGRAEAVVVCVPTPVDAHLSPDLSALRAACRTVALAARPGQTIVLTSTSYVGTTRDLLTRPLEERGLTPGADVFVAFSPERIDPANARHPQESVPRVVGGVTEECGRRAADLLRGVSAEVHVVSGPEAAEMTKLYENTFRAVNIALVNELADVSIRLGLDVREVIDAASTKPYGFMPFRPGPGVGGHCIPCDPHYLLWQLRARRLRTPLVEAAMAAISERPLHVVTRAAEVLAARGRSLRDALVLVLGVAYKPGVRDTRESPALEIIAGLEQRGARVDVHDPLVPAVELGDGRLRAGVARPWDEEYDLVVVHTVHPGADVSWLERCPVVLDASYRVDVPNRVSL